MTQRRSFPRLLLPLAVVLLLALLAAVIIVLVRLRGEVAGDRPVVLIHEPASTQEIAVGHGVLVHATSRFAGGLSRMELWVDGEMAGEVDAAEGDLPSTLLLVSPWEPGAAGYHLLSVRAIGAQGEKGEAAISVVAVEAGQPIGSHVVTEGETVESIAADYGTSPDEVGDLNPSVPSTGPAAGDTLLVPLDFLPSDDPAPAPVSEAEPPAVAEAANPAPEETVRIRLEALELEVDAPYEGVHCYVSVGLTPPAWIPDADHDPATDEFFAPLGGAAWDIASHYAEDTAPSFPWPSDQPLPFEMSCVGVQGGGSDAVELGRVALSIPSSEWDGVTREAESEPAEGRFSLAYRVGPGEIYTLDLDPGMLPPSTSASTTGGNPYAGSMSLLNRRRASGCPTGSSCSSTTDWSGPSEAKCARAGSPTSGSPRPAMRSTSSPFALSSIPTPKGRTRCRRTR